MVRSRQNLSKRTPDFPRKSRSAACANCAMTACSSSDGPEIVWSGPAVRWWSGYSVSLKRSRFMSISASSQNVCRGGADMSQLTPESIRLVLPWPIGAKFWRLLVIERSKNDRFGRTQWRCQCECGNECVVALFRMKSGHTKSCGCAKVGNITHGKSRTKTYNSWLAMKQRCCYEKSDEYHRYGGRGIRVCERWIDSFENFLADMGERPSSMTLDRINPDGDYKPENCRWEKEETQARNRRSTIFVDICGTKKCVKDWCIELGLNADRVYGRIRRGATPEEAIKWAKQ